MKSNEVPFKKKKSDESALEKASCCICQTSSLKKVSSLLNLNGCNA